MKKIRSYILTAVCLFLGACGGDDEIDAPIVTPDEPETQVIKITHEASKFDMPELIFSGYIKASIEWGDSTSQNYNKNSIHIYEKEGTHTITIEGTGIEEITVKSLKQVQTLDFSKY